jgi:transcriptional regulator with XRE-family HTH domain
MAGEEKSERLEKVEGALKAAFVPRASGRQMREELKTALPKAKANAAKWSKQGKRVPYSRERFLSVCEHMAHGLTTREALAKEGISPSTFYQWLAGGRAGEMEQEAPLLRTMFAQARVMLADHAFSEALEVPRALMLEEELDSARVGAARLLTDTLKWYSERLNPEAYAEKRDPQAVTVNVDNRSVTVDARALDAGQRDQLRTLLIQARERDTDEAGS